MVTQEDFIVNNIYDSLFSFSLHFLSNETGKQYLMNASRKQSVVQLTNKII